MEGTFFDVSRIKLKLDLVEPCAPDLPVPIDVEKSASHHQSQNEIGGDNPVVDTYLWKRVNFLLAR